MCSRASQQHLFKRPSPIDQITRNQHGLFPKPIPACFCVHSLGSMLFGRFELDL